MAFDRLLYIDRLKGAGVDDAVARAHAEALRDALQETVATKADLRDLGTKFDSELAKLDHKIEIDLAKLDRKIEIAARDLTIKGAGALVILASLMIGLKLFG